MNEQLLRRIWLAGSWAEGALVGTCGRRLQVVYPGRSGHGPGPDLRDAILALADGTLVRGDVEFHVRTSDWARHGHAGDPAYGRVAVHVVWRHDQALPISQRGPDLTIALASLAPPTLFQRLSHPSPEDGDHAWLARVTAEERGAFLDRLGDERLAAKAATIAADLHGLGVGQAWHVALLETLGYSQNRAPMRRLAESLDLRILEAIGRSATDDSAAEADLFAHLMFAAGFGDRPPSGGGPAIPPLRRGDWNLLGQRPLNRPERRLAGLARLLGRSRFDPLCVSIPELVRAGGLEDPRRTGRRLIDTLRVDRSHVPGIVTIYQDTPRSIEFWRLWPGPTHMGADSAAPLIGRDRATLAAVNAALPFCLAIADARADQELWRATWSVWQSLPRAGTNWIIAEMRPLLRGAPLRTARREQGLIGLYRRCCHERRCATCARPGALAAG